jgi:hypothetical protein
MFKTEFNYVFWQFSKLKTEHVALGAVLSPCTDKCFVVLLSAARQMPE